jgi:hypothetical protein
MWKFRHTLKPRGDERGDNDVRISVPKWNFGRKSLASSKDCDSVAARYATLPYGQARTPGAFDIDWLAGCCCFDPRGGVPSFIDP